MRSKAGKLFYDEWNDFYMGGENEQYMIKSTGSQGDCNVNGYQYSYSGYYFGVPSNSKFFTRDKGDDTKCGFQHKGFWYDDIPRSGGYTCNVLLLNANLPKSHGAGGELISTEMKIRPIVV